jgi:hypothetical protein
LCDVGNIGDVVEALAVRQAVGKGGLKKRGSCSEGELQRETSWVFEAVESVMKIEGLAEEAGKLRSGSRCLMMYHWVCFSET